MYDGVEIFWFWVGHGDAVLIKDWREDHSHNVLIDGGLRKHYRRLKRGLVENGATRLDALVNTHPDQDHIGGLIELARDPDIQIYEAWKHLPERHGFDATAKVMLKSMEMTVASKSAEIIRASMNDSDELDSALRDKGVTDIQEPFAGETIQNFLQVWGPSQEFYRSQVSQFRDSSAVLAMDAMLREIAQTETISKRMRGDDELLENPSTTAENESSAITYLSVKGRNALFTGDAGVQGLEQALDFGGYQGAVERLHAPHHGSRRNLTKDLIERLGAANVIYSAQPDLAHHPHLAVQKAFKAAGAKQFGTWHDSPGIKRVSFGKVPDWTHRGGDWPTLPHRS